MLSKFVIFQSYAIFTFVCKNKYQCNEIHSYLVVVPVSIYIFMAPPLCVWGVNKNVDIKFSAQDSFLE